VEFSAGDTTYLLLSPIWDESYGFQSPIEISIACLNASYVSSSLSFFERYCPRCVSEICENFMSEVLFCKTFHGFCTNFLKLFCNSPFANCILVGTNLLSLHFINVYYGRKVYPLPNKNCITNIQ